MDDATKEGSRDRVIDRCLVEGAKGALVGGLLTGGAVLALLRGSPWFRKNSGPSGRAYIVVSGLAGGFAFMGERSIVNDMRELKKSGKPIPSELTAPLSAVNWMRSHPFTCITAISVPTVAAIAYRNYRDTQSTPSLRVLHTRVIGQFSVLIIVLSAMMLSGHGPFSDTWSGKKNVARTEQMNLNVNLTSAPATREDAKPSAK